MSSLRCLISSSCSSRFALAFSSKCSLIRLASRSISFNAWKSLVSETENRGASLPGSFYDECRSPWIVLFSGRQRLSRRSFLSAPCPFRPWSSAQEKFKRLLSAGWLTSLDFTKDFSSMCWAIDFSNKIVRSAFSCGTITFRIRSLVMTFCGLFDWTNTYLVILS